MFRCSKTGDEDLLIYISFYCAVFNLKKVTSTCIILPWNTMK